jgi:DNA (cytosine-5)-methyltransferase 1
MKSGKTLKMIDLFAGAGGLTLGFQKLSKGSFQTVWANDFDQYAADTYNRNFGEHCVVGDINNILADKKTKIEQVDLVIGGPPCQGFSMLNKNRYSDARKELWRPFLEVVKKSNCPVFVMENVPDLLRSGEFQLLKKEAEKLGFEIAAAKLCAADYGVAQTRTRAFIVGCKFADPHEFFPPKRTHYNPANGKPTSDDYVSKPKPWITVRDAIGDLPAPKGIEIRDCIPPLDLHFGRTPTPTSMARYKAIPKEGMNRFDLQRKAPQLTPDCWLNKPSGSTDIFGRLWWDRPAVTMRTEFFKPEKGRYLHPQQHRPITHREAARFQSFPDGFLFTGSKIEIAKQIGNAVPPLLAAAVANCIKELFAANLFDSYPIPML